MEEIQSYIPVQKNGDKQILDNHRPVSLLPICGKIFEKLLFSSISKFLDNNNLLSSNQSGFKPSYSCEYQLVSLFHDIYASFDCCSSFDVRGIFMDISKTFDRVSHEGLIYKLQSLGISGLPPKYIETFLSNRVQRVLLNGQSSSWSPVLAGMPQGIYLLSLAYNNDLSKNPLSFAKFFADDTFVFSNVHDISLSSLQLNDDLVKISNWAYQWKMSFNPEVTKQAQEEVFSQKSQKFTHATVYFSNSPVAKGSCKKLWAFV